jgi:hypothetical protein
LKSAQNNMQLYPNPANDMVYIEVPDEVNDIRAIAIFDLRGRTVLVKNNPSFAGGISGIDVSGISNGIYQVRITSGKTTKILKLVINK